MYLTEKDYWDLRLSEYRAFLIRNEKSAATVQKYLRDVSRFISFAKGRPFTKELVIEYKSFLGRNFAVNSANSFIAALNSFLKFIDHAELSVKQFKIQRDAYASEEREISKNDYNALIRTAEVKNKRLSLILQTLCGTGIRISELKFVTVEAAKRGEVTVNCKGKIRKIFIIQKLKVKLLKYAADAGIKGGMIFVTKNGNSLDRSNIWREMKALCGLAGVSPKKVFPHNFRHLFARTFYHIEKDIAKLADILGHSSINTTRIYIMTTGAEHRKCLESMRLII